MVEFSFMSKVKQSLPSNESKASSQEICAFITNKSFLKKENESYELSQHV